MKAIKRTLCVLVMLGIMSSFCACQQEIDSFYVKSRKADGSGGKANVVDVLIEKEILSICESAQVIVKLGVGGADKKQLDGTEEVWLEIEAEGCIINGKENVYKNVYEDFYTNDIYRPDVVEHYFAYDDKTPNYYEDVEIVFGDGDCSGTIKCVLYDRYDEWSIIPTDVKIYYAKNENIIVFSAESEYDAQQKLETLTSME